MITLQNNESKFYESHILNVLVVVTDHTEKAKQFATTEEAQAVLDEQPELLRDFKIKENK